jgi:hypothetical protein
MVLTELKEQLQEESLKKLNSSATDRNIKIVAEGDSWFDYKIQKDIIDYLQIKGYAINKELNKADPGDTLENMVYGEDFVINKKNRIVSNPGPIGLNETIASIERYKPRFVLFSAGGNDIVGEEIIFYLNHKESNSSSGFKEEIFQKHVNESMKPAIQKFIDRVLSAQPDTDILMDGYDYAIPNGTHINILGLKKIGPWILPSMGKKGITDPADQKSIVKLLVNIFNDMLIELDSSNPNFHYVKLLGMFPNHEQWHNEIHLKKEGFKAVANVYHKKIVEILGHNPLE